MRRIVRWTIGNVSKEGYDCLRLSIRLWRRLFKSRFEMVVLYNGEPPSVDCPTINQNRFRSSLPFYPTTTSWKLYPPRLDPDAYEIFIDNDLILYEAPDALRQCNDFFITEAWKRCYGKHDSLVPAGFVANSGLFGLPPHFDFGTHLATTGSQWEGHFDEQGLVAAVLARHSATVVPLSDVKVCVPQETMGLGRCGMHFVGLNASYRDHWDNFVRSLISHSILP